LTKLLTILGIALLIVLHELGHFLAARVFGMRVNRFSVGFGPALFSRKIGETVYQLAPIPFGGYVQIQGMGGEEVDPGDGRGFKDKPRWQRALVLLAGPLANWLVAVVCLTLLASTAGLRDLSSPSTVIDTVTEGGAAARAGLAPADRIVAIDGVAIDGWEALVQAIRSRPGKPMTVEVERAGARLTLSATPEDSSGHGVLGIEPAAAMVRYGVLGAVGAGVRQSFALTAQQARLIWGVVTGQVGGKLSGIPGIVKMLSGQAKRSLARFFETLSTLSIVLFVFNIAPVPALDGARIVFLGLNALRKKPISEAVEGWVHGVGLVLLLGLMIFVSVRDLL
jgi:regulator of sigma E protease